MTWVSDYGYVAIYILLTLGIVGLPVPDETLLALTGYLAFRGDLKLLPGLVAACMGAISGITASYLIGRVGGVRLVHWVGDRLHMRKDTMDRVHNWFRSRGHWSLPAAYFIPGFRHVIAIVAGSSSLEFGLFALYAWTGGIVWAGVFICAGYFLGEGWRVFPETMTKGGAALALTVILFLGARKAVRVLRRKPPDSPILPPGGEGPSP